MWTTCERQAKKMWLILSLSLSLSFRLSLSSIKPVSIRGVVETMSSKFIEKSTLVVCRARLTFTDKFLPDRSAFVSQTRPRPIGLFRRDFSLSLSILAYSRSSLLHLLQQRGADEVASRGIKFARKSYLAQLEM